MHHSILTNISRYVTLSKAEEDYFISILIPAKLKQGEFIEKAGEVSYHSIFVSSGCLMTYFTAKEGDDQVIQLSTTGWWTSDLNSVINQQPSNYSTKALADSEILLLSKTHQDELFVRFPVFERYFRLLLQNALVTHQNRIIEAFTVTAEDRYENFQKKYPQLEQHVALKYIASYLGITPEFLSKIRRKRMNKHNTN